MRQKHYLMRFLTLITSLLLTSVLAHAGQITEQEALAKAKTFMQGKRFKTSGRRLTPGKQVNQTFKHLYVFNVEANEGFVIVSGDDRTQSILGYAYTGEINMGQMPCNMKWLLSYYDTAIGQLGDDFPQSASTTLGSATYAEIPAIVGTQWGQGDPYNAQCPQHEGERCITGCVATAMAQIMNHNRWPQSQTTEIPAYTTNTLHISMPALPAKQFNWDNMTTAGIAELMLYCGQAVKMDYTTAASGAMSGDVPKAMKSIFGYSTAASLASRASYTDEQWVDMIYKELQEGYPVLYFGQSATDGGHAFIVDGYADGKYHINWGWNGYCDGYFTLDKLNPNMEDGFNLGQKMVINAWRPAGAEDTNRPKTAVKGITTSTRFLERTATGEAFPAFTVKTTVASDMNTAATIQTGLALYGDNGIVAMLSQDGHDFAVGDSYTMEKEVTIGADIQPGEYRIVSVNRINDSDPWLSDQGSSDRYIAVTVAETSMSIQPMPKSEDDKKKIDFGIHTIDGITYQLVSEYGNNRAKVKLYNETEKYKGDIYIPDYVTYQNMKFKVYRIDTDIFEQSPELTSLSSPVEFGVDNCPQLRSVDIREGVLLMWGISGCPLIESITYPSTCSNAILPQNCQGLKTLTFLYKRGIINPWWGTSCLSTQSLPSLTDIYIDSDIPPTVEGSTETVNPNVTIHVPQGSLENYKQSAWKDWNIVEDRDAVPVRGVNWDYCGPSGVKDNHGVINGISVGCGENDVEFAMRIPAEHLEAYKGCKISAIEYFTMSGDSQNENYEYVFITSRGKDYITKQSVNTVRGLWMRIELNQPYTITGEELFVGIGRHSVLGAWWANEDIAEDGLWVRVMGNDTKFIKPGVWEKNGGISDWNHPLCIRALIEGDNLPDDIAMSSIKIGDGENTDNTKQPAMAAATATETAAAEIDTESGYFTCSVGPDGKLYAPQSSQPKKSVTATAESTGKKTISFKVRNRSMRTVRQITLDPYVDGVQQKPITIDTYLPTNWEDNVTLDLPDLAGRSHNMTFNVTDIDGKPDAVPFNSWGEVNYSLNPATYFPRKIVMEEATGTWCGWCPRGMMTIEQMSKKYPDNFIAIAIHDDAEMQVDKSYKPFLDMVTEYPSARINRKDWRSPWPFDLEDIMDKGEAKVTTQARCLSAKEVEVESETVFGFSDSETVEYRLAYVVTEDNVGPYMQNNAYSNPSAEDNPDDLMNWWVHQDSRVTMTFNEVAREIFDYNGVEGLLPRGVTEGETYKTKYTLTVPDNVKELSNVRIVTLILDTRTGEILNADLCSLSDIPDTSISNITTDDNKRHDIFNSLGMKVGTDTTPAKGLRKGLYIMNGRKVIIR